VPCLWTGLEIQILWTTVQSSSSSLGWSPIPLRRCFIPAIRIWYVWGLSYTINHLIISFYIHIHLSYIFILLHPLTNMCIIIYIHITNHDIHITIIIYNHLYIFISYIWWFHHQFVHTKKHLRPSPTSSAPCRCCLGGCGTGLGGTAVSRQRNWDDAARQGWNCSMNFTWIYHIHI